tara:strand:- start:239 stop:448 length:210 start_codon:yes stop_codon:yes gene_type:complete
MLFSPRDFCRSRPRGADRGFAASVDRPETDRPEATGDRVPAGRANVAAFGGRDVTAELIFPRLFGTEMP